MRKLVDFLLVVALSFTFSLGTISASTELSDIDIETMEIYVDYENTEEMVMPAYDLAKGTYYTYSTTTPVVGVPPNILQSVLLGYVYCFSTFELGAHRAVNGYTDINEINASSSLSVLESVVVQQYATSASVAAQVRHTGDVIWYYGIEASSVPFNLSHYCNVNDFCYNSTYSAPAQ